MPRGHAGSGSRFDLAVDQRVQESKKKPGMLRKPLPYEMIVVAVSSQVLATANATRPVEKWPPEGGSADQALSPSDGDGSAPGKPPAPTSKPSGAPSAGSGPSADGKRMSSALPSALVATLAGLPLPALILAYYALRRRLRGKIIYAKILELQLEKEYLRVFYSPVWEQVRDASPEAVRQRFNQVFDTEQQGNNRISNYFLPFVLTSLGSLLFSVLLYEAMVTSGSLTTFFQQGVIPLAIAGALVYAFPSYISGYASLSLTPPVLFNLLARSALSVLIGIILASVTTTDLKPAAALLGALIPVPALEFLKKKLYDERPGSAEQERKAELMHLVDQDEDLLAQLYYVGIRTVLQLAYENPLRIFVDTDLHLYVCLDLVDQANLYLIVPDKQSRDDLRRHNVRTAMDLMTQTYEEFPTGAGNERVRRLRFLEPDEPLPDHLREPLERIAQAMRLQSVSELRNVIQTMVDNPHFAYLLDLWGAISWSSVERRRPADAEAAPGE